MPRGGLPKKVGGLPRACPGLAQGLAQGLAHGFLDSLLLEFTLFAYWKTKSRMMKWMKREKKEEEEKLEEKE